MTEPENASAQESSDILPCLNIVEPPGECFGIATDVISFVAVATPLASSIVKHMAPVLQEKIKQNGETERAKIEKGIEE